MTRFPRVVLIAVVVGFVLCGFGDAPVGNAPALAGAPNGGILGELQHFLHLIGLACYGGHKAVSFVNCRRAGLPRPSYGCLLLCSCGMAMWMIGVVVGEMIVAELGVVLVMLGHVIETACEVWTRGSDDVSGDDSDVGFPDDGHKTTKCDA